MAGSPPFTVLVHDRQDHRYVARSEVSSHPYFDKCMSTTSIQDYVARDGERFLRSTSKWQKICLYLDNLPVRSRVLPLSFVPADDDVTIQLIRQELSASEDEVRSGKTTMGVGYSFYFQVLQKPSSPEPIPIPQRNLRQSSLESYQFSTSDSNPSTDSSYPPPRLNPSLEGNLDHSWSGSRKDYPYWTAENGAWCKPVSTYTSNTSQDVPTVR